MIALGGSAYALGKNTVGTKQIKNSAVNAKKLKNNAVTTAKIKKGAVTGSKVKLSSLGTVPSATTAATATSATTAATATTANKLSSQVSQVVKLSSGQTRTLASNGSVSIVAECLGNVSGFDELNLYGQTTTPGAVMSSSLDNYSGGPVPQDFLNPTEAKTDREFLSDSRPTGVVDIVASGGAGFVLGADGKMVSVSSDGLAIGLNYLGSKCVVGGVFNLVG